MYPNVVPNTRKFELLTMLLRGATAPEMKKIYNRPQNMIENLEIRHGYIIERFGDGRGYNGKVYGIYKIIGRLSYDGEVCDLTT